MSRATPAGRAYLDLQNRARREGRGTQEYLTATLATQVIRDQALYHGVRVAMDARIATAIVKLCLDVNFGDPVTPAPQKVALPGLRPDSTPIQVLDYPVETVLAEKLATAIDLAEANTRVRGLADIHTVTGAHTIHGALMRDALTATATFRNVDLVPLSIAVGDLARLRRGDYRAYREALGRFGAHLPEDLAEVIVAAAAFADPLITNPDTANKTWDPGARRWTTPR